MQDLKKLIEKLERRVSELESQKKNDFLAFGRNYLQVGNSDSDFLIKTKGQVKILWGLKFIDLIKDGKINVDSKFIFESDSVGVKDGIYLIGKGDDMLVILKIGDNQINLKGEIGTTYVSFQGELKTSGDLKYRALTNIGFIYKNFDEVSSGSLQNGIVYVEADLKLYTIKDGLVSEFSILFPNPFTKLFIIKKADSSKGSLLIVGSGINNSLAFDNCYIYSLSDGMYLESDGSVHFKIGEKEIVNLGREFTIFDNKVVSSMFLSKDANNNLGFRLYVENGKSTLEVDYLIVRNPDEDSNKGAYPITWYYKNNIIQSVEPAEDPNDPTRTGFKAKLMYENEFEIGLILYVYSQIPNDEGFYNRILVPLQVEMIYTEGYSNDVYVSVLEDKMDPEILEGIQIGEVTKSLKGQTVFLIKQGLNPITVLRHRSNNIDLVEIEKIEDASSNDKIVSRIGNIGELNKTGRENEKEVPIEGFGTFSKNSAFLKALYTSDYDLPPKDNSTKFASTEWVNKLLPPGSIIMFHGGQEEIPENWQICDGTNGTPNLIGKFIKAAKTSGETGGQEEIQLTLDNMPKHKHTFVGGVVRTSTDGDHTHTVSYTNGDLGDNANNRNNIVGDKTITTSSAGAHSHTIDMSQASLSEEGQGLPLKWEPSYYALIYIMKLR